VKGVILYGPPASGKSSTTAALTARDPRFALLRKLKAGNRRGAEYDFIDAEQLAGRRAAGALLVEAHRYGNVYAIDTAQVEGLTGSGRIPVVHMGQATGVRALMRDGPWLVVLLWISRATCERRSRHRGDQDTSARLEAWDETLTDYHTHGEGTFPHRFSTEHATPDETAQRIAAIFDASR
jgi:guanylate kinase